MLKAMSGGMVLFEACNAKNEANRSGKRLLFVAKTLLCVIRNFRSEDPNWQAALKILGPCCLDVEETTSRRCFPMNVEELLCF
ncbi:hypothetical protein CMV_008045 [Castanea mollissima]|uniref:Uncharacterized protein n=1 Tax=Castanea mollissima TaxID=60419 RepID=A0A8J4RHA6_9ROSI|nr:hypothetical protein CMV_008045 [Castanea mollissima]